MALDSQIIPNDTDIWNIKSLDQPPLITLSYTAQEFNSITSLSLFNESENLIKLLDQHGFVNEVALFNKLIYKNWNALRKEKYIQFMNQLKRRMGKFFQVKLKDALVACNELKNSTNKNERMAANYYLPSREVYELLLVKLYTSYRLTDSSISLIKRGVYPSLMVSIRNAVFLPNNILFLSNTARLYFFVKKLANQIVLVYNLLRDTISLFKSTDVKWCAEFNLDKLPTSIGIYLPVDNVDKKLDELNGQLADGDDFGVPLEREDECSNENLEDPKPKKANYKKITFKKIKSMVESKSGKQLKSKIGKFLRLKSKNDQEFVQFLKHLIENKKLARKEISSEILTNMTAFDKKTTSKLILSQFNKVVKHL